MLIQIRVLLLIITTIYQNISCLIEDQKLPPGITVDVGGYSLHLLSKGQGSPTIILDHSLGGIEGYLLIEKLSQFGKVCIYDRAGYGWSDRSPHPRTSNHIVKELDTLLTRANIKPPYILIGNSFGSYNLRLYAHQFPEKVRGLILTDGLHEKGMLKMSLDIKLLQLFFISGFFMSILGSSLGIIRLLANIRVFELLKPELKQLSPQIVTPIKRSFYRPKHWFTMMRELWSLNKSSHQLKVANQFQALPIVNIKANSFFKPSFWTLFIPLRRVNKLRDDMHSDLMNLSSNTVQLKATKSGHFVWLDEPKFILEAVKVILSKNRE